MNVSWHLIVTWMLCSGCICIASKMRFQTMKKKNKQNQNHITPNETKCYCNCLCMHMRCNQNLSTFHSHTHHHHHSMVAISDKDSNTNRTSNIGHVINTWSNFGFFFKFYRIKCATQTQPHLLPLCQWLKYRQTHAKHIRMDQTHNNNKNADRLFLCVSITFMRAHEFGYLTMMRLNQKKMCSAGHLCSFTNAYMDGKDDLCDRNCLAFLCYWLLMDIAIPIDLIDIIYLPMALKLSDSND